MMSGGERSGSGVSQVELAAAIGSYVGPLIGALDGVYLSYVLGRSRDKPQEAPHVESGLSLGTALELTRLPRDVSKKLELMKPNIADLIWRPHKSRFFSEHDTTSRGTFLSISGAQEPS